MDKILCFPRWDKKINGQDLNSIIDEEIDFDPRSIMVFTSSSKGSIANGKNYQ